MREIVRAFQEVNQLRSLHAAAGLVLLLSFTMLGLSFKTEADHRPPALESATSMSE